MLTSFYTYTHTHTYTHTYTHIYTHIHTYTHTYIHTNIHKLQVNMTSHFTDNRYQVSMTSECIGCLNISICTWYSI